MDLLPLLSFLCTTHKIRIRKHSQKAAFNQEDLPPFAEDAPRDILSSRLWLRLAPVPDTFPLILQMFSNTKSKASISGSMFQSQAHVQQLLYWGAVFLFSLQGVAIASSFFSSSHNRANLQSFQRSL